MQLVLGRNCAWTGTHCRPGTHLVRSGPLSPALSAIVWVLDSELQYRPTALGP